MHENDGADPLTTAAALRLLSGIDFGRIVFSRYALPTIRPVHHIVVDDTVVVAVGPEAVRAINRKVVTYEADTVDRRTHRGWFVVLLGIAEEITDVSRIRLYLDELAHWLPGTNTGLMAIRPDLVTAVQLPGGTGGASHGL